MDWRAWLVENGETLFKAGGVIFIGSLCLYYGIDPSLAGGATFTTGMANIGSIVGGGMKTGVVIVGASGATALVGGTAVFMKEETHDD